MPKKIISFVQPNFQVGPTSANAWYLPYSVGCLWAYAKQFESITDRWELGEFIFRRDDPAEVAEQIAHHDMVAFSLYIWNKNWSKHLAREIKKRNPNCVLVFGGPEVPVTRDYIYKEWPWFSLAVKQEGEKTFASILENFDTGFDNIAGLVINKDGMPVDTGDSIRINDLDELPSPALTGVYDKLIADNPGVSWAGTIETNRGCPYACTFCDWGSLTYNKVKKFSMDRLKQEIEYYASIKCGSMYIADANFGMFPERDSQIADWIIDAVSRHGYPKVFNMTWAKNKKEEVVGIIKKWTEAGVLAPGLTISVQSLDPVVLKNIKRQNMEMSKIEMMCDVCNRQGVPMNTEMILGLPGETLESWKNNFWRVFDAGNHNGIDVYQAQILENAEMNLTQRSIFKLESVNIRDFFRNSHASEIEEGLDVVISTSTLPPEKMLDAMSFSWYMATTHITGLTTWFARFIKAYKGVSFEKFYTDLHAYLMTNEWFVAEQANVRQAYNNWRVNGQINYPDVGGFKLTGETVLYKTRLQLSLDDRMNWFVDLVAKHVLDHYELAPKLWEDLVALQKASILDFRKLKEYPVQHKFDHNIVDFVMDGVTLEQPTTLEFEYNPAESRDIDMSTFLQLLWYGRRRQFNFTRIKKI